MIARAAVAAGTVLVLDQVTKSIALERLPLGAVVVVVEGLVNLTLVKNPGLAFGLLAGLGPGWGWVVALLSLAALLLLARLAVRMLAARSRVGLIALGLIFGGAVGNLIDRARTGAVVDFIDVHWRGYHWPAFNVADASISVGVLVLALQLVIHDRRDV